jgi:DNA-binding PadR family transcriptional regulator
MPANPDRDPARLLPLTPLSLAILLALAEGDLHGYAILKEVERQTAGQLNVGTGSLYAALQRMRDDALITDSPDAPPAGADARRRYYRLTPFGREVAHHETLRMARVLAVAREKRIAPDTPLPLRPAEG